MSGFYDIHSHLLPHVDDGAASLSEAVELLKAEYKDGVRTIFVTPHYRKRMFEPSAETIRQQYKYLTDEAKNIGSDLQLFLGCEFHAHMDMIELLNTGAYPTMGGTRCVLIEFSETSDFKTIREHCYKLLCSGYRPIIAHAERYPALGKNIESLEYLADLGAYIQMNAGSIIGAEGFGIKRFCKKAVKQDLLHFVGSDAHNMKDRRPMMGKCAEYLSKIMGNDYMEKILIENPSNMIKEGR